MNAALFNKDQPVADRPPRISVVMPVHNVQEFIESSISSILNQSYRSFELLIMDDQSVDSTVSIAEQFQDPRIKVIRSSRHLGLSGQLNKGLLMAQGEFIARMDGDDWADPNRFEEQLRFLDANPDVGICGTNYRTINSKGKWLDQVRSYPTNGVLKYRSFFRNPFCHPSVMFRKTVIEGTGPYEGQNAEDYDLWIKAYNCTNFYILPAILLHYRVHNQSFSIKENANQEAAAKKLRIAHIHRLMQGVISDQKIEALGSDELNRSSGLSKEIFLAYSVFLQCFKQCTTLSDSDLFYIRQESAAVYFSLFLRSKRRDVFFCFLNSYFSIPFFDRTATAYIEHAYIFYFKDRMLCTCGFLMISFIKSPFNKANIILCIQLMKRVLSRLRFRS